MRGKSGKTDNGYINEGELGSKNVFMMVWIIADNSEYLLIGPHYNLVEELPRPDWKVSDLLLHSLHPDQVHILIHRRSRSQLHQEQKEGWVGYEERGINWTFLDGLFCHWYMLPKYNSASSIHHCNFLAVLDCRMRFTSDTEVRSRPRLN